MPHHVRDLAPQWVVQDGRGPVGLSLLCPEHPWQLDDRHTLYFDNPPDGGPPAHPETKLVTLLGDLEPLTFEHLTVLPLGGHLHDVIQVGHWRGWLADGHLTEASFGALGW